jgi:hypothetical protein
MINRTKGETHGCWDHPVVTLDSTVDLQFVDLFDWNSYGFLDMSLVVAAVSGYAQNPDVVGHRLNFDLRYADIVPVHEKVLDAD